MVLNNPVNLTDFSGDSVDVSNLSQEQQATLVAQLSELTGMSIYVNGGMLLAGEVVGSPGQTRVNGGSATARADLQKLMSFKTGDVSHGKHMLVRAGSSSQNLGGRNSHIVEMSFAKREHNNISSLNSGVGMTFLHEGFHFSRAFSKFVPGQGMLNYGGGDGLGGSRQADMNFWGTGATGSTVDHMNIIRNQLGFNNRTAYGSKKINGRYYLPYDQASWNALYGGRSPIVPPLSSSYLSW